MEEDNPVKYRHIDKGHGDRPVGRQIEDVDIDLVQGVIERDQKAFEELYNKHYSMVHYVVKKVMSDRLPVSYQFNVDTERCHSDFDDVAQEVFDTVWNKIEQFTPERSTFRFWLSGVARNQALNSSGTRKRYGNYFVEGESIASSSKVDGIDWIDLIYKGDAYNSYGGDPVNQVLRDEWVKNAREKISLAQGVLTNDVQKKIVEALVDELDQNEPQSNGRQEKRTKFIASGGYERLGDMLGISPSAAKSALFRAKNTMKEELFKSFKDEEGCLDIDPYV